MAAPDFVQCARKQDGPLRPAAMPDDGQGGAKYFERSNLKETGAMTPLAGFVQMV